MSTHKHMRHYYLRHVYLTKSNEGKEAFGKRMNYLFEPYGYVFEAYTITRLYNLWKGVTKAPKTIQTIDAEVVRLEECFKLPPELTYVDIFCGKASIAKSLPHLRFLNNDLKPSLNPDFSFDAFNPAHWVKELKKVDAFVTSPPFELLDVALADLYGRCSKFIALHTSGDFVSNANPYRAAFFAKMQQEGKAALIYGLPNINGRRCAWVVVFKCARYMKSLLKSNKHVKTFAV